MKGDLGYVRYKVAIETMRSWAAELEQTPKVAAELARSAEPGDVFGPQAGLVKALSRPWGGGNLTVSDTLVALGAPIDDVVERVDRIKRGSGMASYLGIDPHAATGRCAAMEFSDASGIAEVCALDQAIAGMRSALQSLIEAPYCSESRTRFRDYSENAATAYEDAKPILDAGPRRVVGAYRERLFQLAQRGQLESKDASSLLQKLRSLRDRNGTAITPFNVVGSDVPHGLVEDAHATRVENPAAWADATARDDMFLAMSLESIAHRSEIKRQSTDELGEIRGDWHEIAASEAHEVVGAIARSAPRPSRDFVLENAPRGLLADGTPVQELQAHIWEKACDPERLASWMAELVREVGDHASNHSNAGVRSRFEDGKLDHRAFIEVIKGRAEAAGFGEFAFAFDYIEPNAFQDWLSEARLVVDPFYSGKLSVGPDGPQSNGSRGTYSWPLQFLYMASIDPRAPELLAAIGSAREIPEGSTERQPDGPLKTRGQIAQDALYLSRPGTQYSLLNADVMGLIANALMPGLTSPLDAATVEDWNRS